MAVFKSLSYFVLQKGITQWIITVQQFVDQRQPVVDNHFYLDVVRERIQVNATSVKYNERYLVLIAIQGLKNVAQDLFGSPAIQRLLDYQQFLHVHLLLFVFVYRLPRVAGILRPISRLFFSHNISGLTDTPSSGLRPVKCLNEPSGYTKVHHFFDTTKPKEGVSNCGNLMM